MPGIRITILLLLQASLYGNSQVTWNNGLLNRDKLMSFCFQPPDLCVMNGNIASLANTTHSGLGIGASRPFLLDDGLNYQLALSRSSGENHFGAWLTGDRVPGLQQTTIGLAYARKLEERIAVGIGITSQGWRFSNGYGNANAIGGRLGFLVALTDKLQFGIHVDNLVSGKFGKIFPERPLRSYLSGLGITISPHLSLLAVVTKEESKQSAFNMGLHYQPASRITLEAGMSTAGRSLWISTGIEWQRLWFTCSTGYHPVLGFSPGLRLNMRFLNATNQDKKKEQVE